MARQDGAHGEVVGRSRAELDANRTSRLGNKSLSYLSKHRRHVSSSLWKHEQAKFYNLSNPKPEHTTGGSGRSARRSGRAGSGKIGVPTEVFAQDTKVHRSLLTIETTSL